MSEKKIKNKSFSSNFLKYIFRVGFLLITSLVFFNFNIYGAEAAVRTWTGTTSGLWSVASNWGGTAPVTGDDLVFPGGASNLSNTNDLTENTIINSITLSGSGYTLSGNRIILGQGLAGITDSVASGGNTIVFDIRVDATRDIVVTNTAESLTISGRISGTGGLNKEGTGTLILSGANTFGGTFKINVGVVNARHSTALGTIALGTEVVGGAALELQGNINISYEALALRGYGVSNGGALRNISGDNTFGGLITLSSAGGTEISSDSGTLTVKGGTTGNFPLVFDGSGNLTFSTTPLGGSGAITKNGSGTVTYNFPNTNSGLLTINTGTLLYGVDNAILSGGITITGGTLNIATFSDMVGTVTLGTLDLASGTITGSTGMLSSATWTVYNGTISAIIAGDGGALTKSTPGTVTLTRPNQYTGATAINAGILEIQGSTSLGLIDGITTVAAGATLQINGSELSIPEYITFSGTGHLYTGAIRNRTGNNTLTGLLTLGTVPMIMSDTGTTLTIDSKGLSATTVSLTIGGEGNTTFTSTAPIYGTTAALVKNDSGILTIQSFSNFTGATNINRGTLLLSSAGAIPLSTININSGGTLTLDNSSTTILNRISDTLAFTLNGGNFNFIGNTVGASSETAGALTLPTGHNIVTVTPGAGGSTTMTFASLSRTAGASVLFRGTNFGSAAAANVSTLLFTTAPTAQILGAGGAEGSTTMSVLKGAFGDTSLSGTGSDMVTVISNKLRLLTSGEYAGDLQTANANVKLTADRAAVATNTNSLILNNFGITNPVGAITIPISSASLAGNILINSATNIAGANTTLGITTTELNILATANSTISAIIGTATTGSMTLSGTGNVTISSVNPFTGLTSINGATLTYGVSNVLSSGDVTVNGGTLNINGSSDTVGAVILQNGIITGGAGILTSTASFSFREGTVSAIIAGSVTVTVVATNAPANTVVIMTRDNTYSGTTWITSGILKLGAAGGATNTPLGTTVSAMGIASGGALDLNGFSLGTAEDIGSLAGTGFGPSGSSNMGAIMNSSVTSVSYSGNMALGAAARINADAGTIIISGNISGNSALTFGGFSNITYSGVRSGTSTSTIVKDGIGVLTLSNGNSSYAGATTISVGTVKIGAVSVGGTNSPLGTAAVATTVALGARLDLNGFNLGIAEPLTLNGVGYGLGDFASGALINSSGSAVTYTGLITLASASTIKADSGDISLTAAGTISGSGFGLTLGGSGIGSLASIIGTVAGTVTKIGTGTWTLSGQNTYTGATSVNLGTLKLGVSGSGATSPLGTAAAGTSVLSGAVLDLNGFTISNLAEGLTINGRGINDGGALIGANVTFTGAIAQATDSRITNASGTFTLSAAVSGAFALYVGGAGNITTSAVFPAVALSITKQGAGTLTVTGANLYTGITRVDAGSFTYASTGTTTLVATNLTVNGGTFNNSNNADTIGTVTLVGGTITNSVALTAATSYTLESGTISGIIAGAIPVVKNTNNTVTLTGVNTISSTATINAGTLTISGLGSAVSVTGVTVNLGGTLTLDNNVTAVASRILDTLVLTMNGGNFNFIGNNAGASSETIGQLLFSTGHNIVTVTPITPGVGGATTLTVANNPGFNRTAGATVLFRGTSFGSAPAANVSTLLFTTAPTLTGAGGGANTTTASIIKGAFGDTSLGGTGSDMVTYNLGNTNGLRLLNGAGFSGEYAGDLQTANANVKLTADRAAVATNTNSLILNNFGITNPVGAITIPISSASLAGNILINSATNIAGANTTLGITTTELNILATANSTISAIIGTATTGSMTLSGTGNVTMSAANLYTSTTFINSATLTYGTNNVLSSGGVTMRGGIYNLNGNSDIIGALSLTGSTVTTGAGTLTGNGSFTTATNANFSSIISGSLGLGANATFNIGDGLMDNDVVITAVVSGAFTLTKSTGAGVLMLANSNTYNGLTTVSAGILRLGAAGDATNTPLGTTAAGTTISGATSALDLNGYTLGTAEGLTLSGALATGALQNTSSTAVNYSGQIILGAASTIISNYGDINITATGNITGTYNLTIGGAGNGTLSSNLNTSTGTLTKNGFGVWTISGEASTFTGLTTISAGTLKLGSAGSGLNTPLGTVAGGITITAGAILDLAGFNLATAEPIGSFNGTGIANIGALINTSNNSISFTGAITLGVASRIVNYGSGVLTLTGAIGGNFALTLVTIGGITQSSASVRSGTSTIIKEGSGILILAGQNSFTGAVTVSTGTLQLGAAGTGSSTTGPLGSIAGGVTVSAGAVLDLSTFTANGASTWEPLTLAGSGILNGGALISNSAAGSTFATVANTNARIVNNGGGTLTIAGITTGASTFWVGGSGNTTISGQINQTAILITKYGAGTLTISNATNTVTSLVRINEGTLAYGVADAFSTPPITVAGGTLNLAGFNETNIGAVTLIDGSIINSGGAATLTSTATYTLEKGTISAVLNGAVVAVIAKNTAGQVILSGDNTFNGVSATIAVNAGYLNLRHSNALGAAASANTTTILGGATLELENSITLPSTKAITANGTGVANAGAIRNVSGTNAIGANIVLGTTNVRINSDSGTLTFPTMSGNTFNSIFGGAGQIVVSGIISTTTGSLTKDGAGTITLSGVNTYAGSTTIIEGTIIANSTSSIGDGSATNTLIFRGGTLQATGTITSPVNRAVTLAYGVGIIDTNSNSVSVAGTVGGTGGLTKSGAGTLTITGVTTIGGNLSILVGTFVAPTSLTISGNFTDAGTFTHNSGTVVFNGAGVSEIDGNSTVFYNFTVATSDKTIKFKQDETVQFDGLLTLTGTSGHNVVLDSINGLGQWIINHQGTESVDYVTVNHNTCHASSTSITNTNTTDGGTNIGNCWGLVVSGVTISGVVYDTTETAPLLSALAMKLAVGAGTSYTTTSSASNGTFSFTGVETPGVGSVITIWLNTGAGTEKASLVFKYGTSCTGTPNCTGLSLYQNQVTINNKYEGSITNANLAVCDNDSGSSCSDTDIGFTTSPFALTFATNTLKVASGTLSNSWYSTGGTWNKRKAITIDHTKVPDTDSSGGETNFPVLINITDTDLQANAKTDGYDILFTSDDKLTKLSHEREVYTTGTGALTAWVKIPALSSTVDTVIYMYYGNASASDQQSAAAVWSNNYIGVWHLGDGSTLSLRNSVSGTDATDSGITAVAGQIGGAANFPNTTSAITTEITSNYNNITFEAWTRATSNPVGNWAQIIGKRGAADTYSEHNWNRHYTDANYSEPQYGTRWSTSSANWYAIPAANILQVNNTYYSAVTYDAGSTSNDPIFYRNNVAYSVFESSAPSGVKDYTTTAPFMIGNRGALDRGFLGWLDEVRISNTVRSADWITTGYNNQNATSTFYSIGSQISEYETTNVAFAPGVNVTAQKLSVAGGYIGGSETITLTGSGDPLVVTGTFTPNSSTVAYTGTSATNILNIPYYNLSLTPAGTPTYSIPASSSWYSTGGTWNKRKAVTIDHTKVPNTNQTDFPVLINITDSGLQANAKTDGYDILFTSSDGTTKLSHEREIYTTSTGALIAWVKVPTLSTTVDTVIYMYYGNAAATDQQNVAGTWNANYKGVWHLSNGTTLSATDSIGNGSGSTSGTPVAGAGKIDGAMDMDSTNDYINAGSSSEFNFTSSAFTLEAWIKPPASGQAAYEVFLGRGTYQANGWYIQTDSSANMNGVFFVTNTAGTYRLTQAVNKLTLSEWNHVVAVRSGTSVRIYVNGTDQTTSAGSHLDPVSVSTNLLIGGWLNGMDEVRISNTNRSADWILAEYNNQNSPSTFYAVGTEENNNSSILTISNNLTIGNGANAVVFAVPAVGITVGGATNIASGTLNLNTNNTPATFVGNVTVAGTLSAPASSLLTLKGDFTNNGTFTHNNGTITFNPTSVSSILGNSTTFYNLTFSSVGKTLQFKNGNTYTFAGTINLSGESGNPIFVSSDSAGVQWLATMSGGITLSYVSLKDAACSGGNSATPSEKIIDRGNNGDCWGLLSFGGGLRGIGSLASGGGSGGGTPIDGGVDLGGGSGSSVVDSYSEANYDFTGSIYGATYGLAQSFTASAGILDSAKFYLLKSGLPTGNAVAKIYTHSGSFGTSSVPTGTALATSDNFNVATLTGSMGLTTLTFSGANRITLTNTTNYVLSIEYGGGDGSNFVYAGGDTSAPSHSGNASYYSGGWITYPTADLVFYLYKAGDVTEDGSGGGTPIDGGVDLGGGGGAAP